MDDIELTTDAVPPDADDPLAALADFIDGDEPEPTVPDPPDSDD